MSLQGIAASPGIAIGRVILKINKQLNINQDKIPAEMVDTELTRLEEALASAGNQLTALQAETAEKLGEKEAEIFAAHQMLLNDPELISEIKKEIKDRMNGAESAVSSVINRYADLFAAMEDEYMRGREADIRDIGSRIINNLQGRKEDEVELEKETVIVARDLTPSDTARLDTDRVVAFVTGEGSRTSHSAIMARSLGIPAVVGIGWDSLQDLVNQSDRIIVDGSTGKVFVQPDQSLLRKYQVELEKYQAEEKRLEKYRQKKAVSKDGKEVELAGNIGSLADVELVLKNGGEGIGLFRTEFLYMDRDQLPAEEEQFEVYRQVAEKMGDRPVVIRTLDIGGDKDLSYLQLPDEMNPFLGYRAIRLCLDRPEIFKPQLKAILRAAYYGNIKMMYPMISSLEQLRAANSLLHQTMLELDQQGKPYNRELEVGIMIEIPAAVMIADGLAGEVDFFSIGTNDLIQYALAVDRINEKIASLYNPYHPAVLKLIKKTIEAGHGRGIWVGMCGEVAGDRLLLPFLLGAGLDEFSMSAVSILKIKELLTRWTVEEAEEVTERVLQLKTAQVVKDFLQEKYLEKNKGRTD